MKIHLFLLTLLLSFTLPTIAQTTPETLLQQGKTAYDRADYPTAITNLKQAEQLFTSKRDLLNTAATLSNLSLVYQQLGQLDLANQAIDTSLDILKPSQVFADRTKQRLIYAQSLQIQAQLLRRQSQGEIEKSSTDDEAKLPWQCPANDRQIIRSSFSDRALAIHQQAIEFAPNPQLKTTAQLNYLNLLATQQSWTSVDRLWRNIDLTQLPVSQKTVSTRIDLAKSLYCSNRAGLVNSPISIGQIESILTDTINQSQQLANNRNAAYTIGNAGGFYLAIAEIDRQKYLQISEQLTRQALLLAQPIDAPDLAYQWQWQLGRIYANKGQINLAIESYNQALNTLKIVRNDLLSTDSNAQFSFRDNVEPVYRELVDLLVRADRNSQRDLNNAIETIDALQLAELQNFLRCDLTRNTSVLAELERTKSQAALIYPIVLKDRIVMIAKLPGKPLVSHQIKIDRATVVKRANAFRRSILDRNSSETISQGKEIYQWLITPLESDLAQTAQVKQLVFVLDSALRNIPVGALFNPKTNQYLIEQKYALSILPTSQSLDLRPFRFNQNQILAAGISEGLKNVEQNNFAPLNIRELRSIGATKLLLNSQFTPANLQQELKSGNFPILHLATHGKFSSTDRDTYLLAYNQLLYAQDLDRIFRAHKLELLVLSACETATGDKRATLGLAGLSLRAGANSTLSTLWQINDESTTKLMTEFYQQLKQGNVTKAEALHLAQKKLLAQPEYQNPYFWGAYVLIGNWL